MQITIIITTCRKEGRPTVTIPTFCQERSHTLRATVENQKSEAGLAISSGYKFITCVVLFVLRNLSLGWRQSSLGGLQHRGRELQHPRA